MSQGLESSRAIRQTHNCAIVGYAKVQTAALTVGKSDDLSSSAFRIFQLTLEFPVLVFTLGKFCQ